MQEVRHKNKIAITGFLVDEPKLHILKSTRLLSFTLKNIEDFVLANDRPGTHENFFTCEVLGRNIDKFLRELKVGDLYDVEAYLRVDPINGVERVRLRVFSIQSVWVERGDR